MKKILGFFLALVIVLVAFISSILIGEFLIPDVVKEFELIGGLKMDKIFTGVLTALICLIVSYFKKKYIVFCWSAIILGLLPFLWVILSFLVMEILINDNLIATIVIIVAALGFIIIGFVKKEPRLLSTTIKVIGITLLVTRVAVLLTFSPFGKSLYSSYKMRHSIIWASNDKTATIPFTVGEDGFLFIKVNINGEHGYLIFDTGADVNLFNEKFNSNSTGFSSRTTDSNGIVQESIIHQLDTFVMGDILIEKLKYSPLEEEAWEQYGIFHKQDSILGILGNNVINGLVWDIDMINRQMHISEKLEKEPETHSEAVPLIKSGQHWNVEVIVNGQKRFPILDFGSNSALNLTDTIPLNDNYNYPNIKAGISSSAFSYKLEIDKSKMDSVLTNDNNLAQKNIIFVNIEVGDQLFKKVAVNENAHASLLGIPFIWAYQRIILDYNNEKMYLINPGEKESENHINTLSRKRKLVTRALVVANKGYYDNYHEKPLNLMLAHISTNEDSAKAYSYQGMARYYGQFDAIRQKLSLDSIECFSQLRINGKEVDDCTINLKENVWLNGEKMLDQVL